MVYAFVHTNIPKYHFVRVIDSLDETGDALAKLKLVAVDVLGGQLAHVELACVVVQLREERHEAMLLRCGVLEVGVYRDAVLVKLGVVKKLAEAACKRQKLITLAVEAQFSLKLQDERLHLWRIKEAHIGTKDFDPNLISTFGCLFLLDRVHLVH